MKCWCGERNAFFSEEPYENPCGGTCTLYCFCGGDICICHNHGELECPGCDDCDGFGSPLDDVDEYPDPDELDEDGT